MAGSVSMLERYVATMVLSGAGDALGYKGGAWEFCHSGAVILTELKKLGGLDKVKVNKKDWCVSDDTVMHLATAEALVSEEAKAGHIELYHELAARYKESMRDMAGRAPGATCMMMTHKLKPNVEGGYKIPFNSRGGGCGAAMRAMCIGLRYPREEDEDDLIAVSIESGRMTHHHPTGYLGALAAALFVAYSIRGKPPVVWGQGLLDILPRALDYIVKTKHDAEKNKQAWSYFEDAWQTYIALRDLSSGTAKFPDDYTDPDVRDKFYKKLSFSGWGGASGHDSAIIAYDAVLGSGDTWNELCNRGMFHGGDSDSTGTIAAATYGARFGFQGVPQNNYKKLEYRDRLEKLGTQLYHLAFPDKEKKASDFNSHTAEKAPNLNMDEAAKIPDLNMDESTGTPNFNKDESTKSPDFNTEPAKTPEINTDSPREVVNDK